MYNASARHFAAASPPAADVVRHAPDAGASPAAREAFLAGALATLDEHGIVIIEDAIPHAVIAETLRYFETFYDGYMRGGQKRLFRNYQDDPKRAQIPVAPADALANPALFANPLVMTIVERVIGTQAVIGEMGAVISHPGADAQYTHRDSNFLFGGIPAEIPLPPPSLSMLVPLLDIPLEMGPTEYWPGSHRIVGSMDSPSQRVAVKAGSVLIWDARLLHRGGANLSSSVRPVLYIDYQRPWFIERSGYEGKPQVRITPAMLARLPEQHRRLFAWALHLNRSDSFDEFMARWVGRIRARLGF